MVILNNIAISLLLYNPLQHFYFLLPFTTTSFVSLPSLSLCCWLGEAGKIVINSLLLAYVLFCCVCLCVSVSEVGLAEMSKAGSHAISGAADIAPAVGGLQGALLKVKELWHSLFSGTNTGAHTQRDTHPITYPGKHAIHPLWTGYNWMIPEQQTVDLCNIVRPFIELVQVLWWILQSMQM